LVPATVRDIHAGSGDEPAGPSVDNAARKASVGLEFVLTACLAEGPLLQDVRVRVAFGWRHLDRRAEREASAARVERASITSLDDRLTAPTAGSWELRTATLHTLDPPEATSI
jgi:hypothetical protein